MKMIKTKMKSRLLSFITFLTVLLSGDFAHSEVSLENSGLIFILDNSGSMAEVFNGDTKLNTAKKSIDKVLGNPDFDSLNTGLVEIGGHCEVKELVPAHLNNRQAIITASSNVRSRPHLDAATPIAASIKKASEMLKKYSGKKQIILVSDGEANCQGEGEFPLSACDMVASLKNQGIDFSLDLIGYGADNDRNFQCIADLSDNYSYVSVNDPEALTKKIEENTNFWQESKTLIDQITELVISFRELIAAIVTILVILGLSNNGGSSEEESDTERW